MVDQRRAHERILYERMLDALEKKQPLSQQSLFPETIRLNASDYQVCLEMMGNLEQLGFDIRDFGNNSIVVHGLPAEMEATDTGNKIELMIEQYKSLQGEISTGIPERIARAAARSSAIDYGKQLSEIEMQELVDQLFACSSPNYSPSGQLVVKIIELEELDKHFKD